MSKKRGVAGHSLEKSLGRDMRSRGSQERSQVELEDPGDSQVEIGDPRCGTK
jgi:hypothetical protein